MPALTSRDSIVLKSLFDPEATAAPLSKQFSSQTSLPGMDEHQFSACRSTELHIISHLQDESSNPTSDVIRKVIDGLSTLINESPGYASAYVNRAQANRLIVPLDGLFASGYAKSSKQILSDLRRGIELAEPQPNQQPSAHQTTVLAAAYTHRGFLLLKIADVIRKGGQAHGTSETLQTASADKIEEQASRDFAAGGQYGNKEARDMAVKTNPYAKMCGAIVKEALRKETEEWKAGQLC